MLLKTVISNLGDSSSTATSMHISGRTNVKMFTSPDVNLFNLSTVEMRDLRIMAAVQRGASMTAMATGDGRWAKPRQ